MKYFGWVFLFFTVVYLLPLASRPLTAPHEFCSAELARSNAAASYYTLQSAGENASKELPPLGYWMVRSSFKLFGENSFAARFPMAISAGLMALFVWILVRQSSGDEKLAALASVILLCCSAVYLCGTSVLTEVISAMFTVGGAGCIFMAIQEQKFSRRKAMLLILSAAFAAASFLAGGVPGVEILFVTALVYIISERRLKELLFTLFTTAVLTALLLLPYLKHMYTVHPEILSKVLQDQVLQKPGYPWYAMPLTLIVGMFPVALLIPAACFVGRDAWKTLIQHRMYRYALCFTLAPLIYFCLPGTRSILWLLPCFAPLSVLIAAGVRAYFNSGGHHRAYNWMMTIWGGLMILTGLVLALFSFFPGIIPAAHGLSKLPVSQFFCPVIGFVCIISGALMLYSISGNWRGRLYLFFFALGLLPLCSNWLIADNAAMPENGFRELRHHFKFDPETTIIYSDRANFCITSWSYRKNDVIELDSKTLPGLLQLIRDPQRSVPLAVISGAESKFALPNAKKFTLHGISAYYYPANK